jgi:hypothetical protein
MGTTRAYACTTQAALTRLGSHVRRTSRVLLGLCARRATLLSLLPWRRVLQRLPHLERCPEKPVPIAGAQLCPWNARRELYQKVGNFVGSVVSPLLALIALHGIEEAITHVYPEARVIAYADDGLVLHPDRAVLEHGQQLFSEWLAGIGLTLHTSKTRLSHTLADEQPGRDFLGFPIRQ